MKRLIYINAMIVLALFACKKDEGLSDADHKSKFIKAMGTAAEGVDLKQTSDGGYILLGTAQGAGGTDIYLKKVDAFGNHQWSKTYDGPLGGSNERASAIEILSDDSYLILGTTLDSRTQSKGGDSFTEDIQSSYLVRLDYQGNILDDATYCSTINFVPNLSQDGNDTLGWIPQTQNELGLGLEITPLGNYLITSEKEVVIPGSGTFKVGFARLINSVDLSLNRLDSADLTISANNEENISFVDAAFTVDGLAVITGYLDKPQDQAEGISVLMSAYNDNSGEFDNSLPFGGPQEDRGNRIKLSSEGMMVIAGFYTEFGLKQFYALAFSDPTDLTPTPDWEFINDASVDNEACDFIEVSDGYILAGFKETLEDRQFYLVKISKDGSTKMWEKDYGYTGFDEAKAIVATDDNGLAVLGTSSDERGNRVMTLLKLDASGNLR